MTGCTSSCKTWGDHLRHPRAVLDELRRHHLFVKRTKCAFAASSIAYLGHVISAAGVAMDLAKVHAIIDWPAPRSVRVVWARLARRSARCLSSGARSRPSRQPGRTSTTFAPGTRRSNSRTSWSSRRGEMSCTTGPASGNGTPGMCGVRVSAPGRQQPPAALVHRIETR
jgi:hypothetical protein